MSISIEFRNGLLASTKRLHKLARSITSNKDRAEDLVQDTLVKALKHADKFEAGSNLFAWLTTIMRNTYCSDMRKRFRHVEVNIGGKTLRFPFLRNKMPTKTART